MTAHPAWPQSQYEKNGRNSLAAAGGPAEAITCRRRQGRAVKAKQEGTPIMHFDDKKVIVVGGSAGMGRRVAVDIVDHGGSAVTVGRSRSPTTWLLSLPSR